MGSQPVLLLLSVVARKDFPMSIFRDSHETPLADEILSLVAYWRGGSSFACFRHVTLMRGIWTERCWVSVQATLLRKLASVPTL